MTPLNLLAKLGAHVELLEHITIRPFRKRPNAPEWLYSWQSAVPHWPTPIFFSAGAGSLNPIPTFLVTQILPGLVVGAIGAIVNTEVLYT